MISRRFLVIAVFVTGCGGAVSESPPLSDGATDTLPSGQETTLTRLTAEQIESGYPCDLPARALVAVPLDGPFDSHEAFAGTVDVGALVPIGPTLEYGDQSSVFSKGMVVSPEDGGAGKLFVAVLREGKWFFSKNLVAPGEKGGHEGPVFLEQGEGFADRMMVNLEISGPGDGPVAGRSITVSCSTGDSGVPSCVEIPESFELCSGEAPVTARLRTLPCDDGSVVIYGNPTLLPPGEEERARDLLGRRLLVFP